MESVIAGSHWSVAQRLELPIQEGISVTPLPELTAAQKESYAEAKIRQQAAQADGRPGAGKGANKGRDSGKDGNGKGGKSDRRPGGKGGSWKNDGKQKGKEENPTK